MSYRTTIEALLVIILVIVAWKGLIHFHEKELARLENDKLINDNARFKGDSIYQAEVISAYKDSLQLNQSNKIKIVHHYEKVYVALDRISFDSLSRLHTKLLRQYRDTDWNQIDSGF